ncbi:MAG: hypothetical protein F6K36_05895 [Symploca sp. SIO3C6]|nr:hypothetical protein [Symploca sp. SIO3C6]
MIISDLSYLEVVEESKIVGGGYYKDFTFNVDGDVDINVDVNLDFDKDVFVDVDAYVDITGTSAFAFGEATALGDNATAEVNLVTFTSDDVAEATGSAYSATA